MSPSHGLGAECAARRSAFGARSGVDRGWMMDAGDLRRGTERLHRHVASDTLRLHTPSSHSGTTHYGSPSVKPLGRTEGTLPTSDGLPPWSRRLLNGLRGGRKRPPCTDTR